jgi:formylglycine-generating enzyme required for sulfatase activity
LTSLTGLPAPHNQDGRRGLEGREPLEDRGVSSPRSESGVDIADRASLGEGGSFGLEVDCGVAVGGLGEFLAALELAWRGSDGWAILRPHALDPAWSEVVLLLAGCLWKRGPGLVPKLIDNILALGDGLTDRAQQVRLIVRILRDVRVRAEGRDPSAKTGYAAALREMLAAFEPGGEVPEKVRVEVGEALGQAGDPRISDDDHADRIFIEGGAFWMGAQKDDRTQPGYDPECDGDEAVHRVTLTGFWIDRYPVTVNRFRRFVEAGAEGYLDERFWSAEGWRWRKNVKRTEPRSWADQLSHSNRPVVSVSWYEAEAYCAWLSARSGHRVSLPTEAQWEYAARGGAGRKYPWGDAEPTDRHMNFKMRVVHATPVGIYPEGATPEGVQELSGNAWEWCRDWRAAYQPEDQTDPLGPNGGTSRVLRGGGFDLNARGCRAAYRFNNLPELGLGYVGFRCVVLASGGQHD